MATRGQPISNDDIREPEDPGIPANEPDRADPMVASHLPAEGVTTMGGLFGKATVVDEVVEQDFPVQAQVEFWVIRPGLDIEDMTVGAPENHYAFKSGVRYRVPLRIAEILYNRDHLIEVPYPYEEQRRR